MQTADFKGRNFAVSQKDKFLPPSISLTPVTVLSLETWDYPACTIYYSI